MLKKTLVALSVATVSTGAVALPLAATAADLPALVGSVPVTVLPSYSREVLRAGPDPAALRAAADRARASCEAALSPVAPVRRPPV